MASATKRYVGGSAGVAPSSFRSGSDLYNYALQRNSMVPSVSNLPRGFTQDVANNMYDLGTQYQGAQDAFTNLYGNLVTNKIPSQDLSSTLSSLVDYSKQASNLGNQYGQVANKYFNPASQIGSGGQSMANANDVLVQKQFTLPEKTWSMSQPQLVDWIKDYEKRTHSGGIGGAIGSLGKSFITGAALGGLGLDPITTKLVNTGLGMATSSSSGGGFNPKLPTSSVPVSAPMNATSTTPVVAQAVPMRVAPTITRAAPVVNIGQSAFNTGGIGSQLLKQQALAKALKR